MCILSKLLHRFHQILHSDKDHQMPYVGGLNRLITNPRWRTAAIFKNKKYRHISAAVRAILTKFGTMRQFDPLDVTFGMMTRIGLTKRMNS